MRRPTEQHPGVRYSTNLQHGDLLLPAHAGKAAKKKYIKMQTDLFVHLDVQAVGHLVVLRDRAEALC